MNKEENIVPELRFPEFLNNSEWVNKPLNNLCKFVRGPFGGALKKEIFVKEGYAVYEQSQAIYNQFEAFRYFITEEKFKELKRFAVDSKDIIMSCSGTMGKFAIIPEKFKKGVINQALLKLTVKEDLIVDFIKISLELPINQRKLLSQSAGGAIKNVVGVSELKKIKISIPTKQEQQKIANCLSSLDDVINAETEKLNLLQDHKKGLLQQLFPQQDNVTLSGVEGQPKYRFPEFLGDGDWDVSTLGDIAKFRRGSFPQPYGRAEWYDDENGMPFIQVYDVDSNLKIKPNTKRRISELAAEKSVFIAKGTVIITLQGSIGRVAITQYDAYIDRTLLLFEEFYKPLDKLFFAYVIQLLFEIEKEKAPGGIIKTITKEVLTNFNIYVPKIKEQQKIADCLSSVDELIVSQQQKIEGLKAHKKGLLQKLFPKV